MMTRDRVLTPQQVADQLQVTTQTVVRWLRKGQLKGSKLGRLWRITEEDVDAFLQERRKD
jgi:excisionase family DNA binding protein